MGIPQIVILALVDGVADILPIDSSGHGLLVGRFLGASPPGAVALVHLAAGLALAAFLWRDVALAVQGLWRLRRRRLEPGTYLVGKIALACLPCIIVAAWYETMAPLVYSSPTALGLTTLVCAGLMALVDRLCLTVKRIEHIGAGTSFAIGLAQVVAFIPGVGRTALALTVARAFGLERPAAWHFVLLANIAILISAGWREAAQSYGHGVVLGDGDILAGVLAFVLVLLAAQLADLWFKRNSLLPFAVFRVLVGGGLLALGMR